MNDVQRLRVAASSFARGELGATESECRRLLSESPGNPDALHLLGLVLRRQGKLADAESFLRRSIEQSPDRAEFRVNLGNLLRASRRYRDAEAEYRAALGLDPSSRAARLALARTLNDGGASAAAEQEARRLLRADERDAEAWVVLGTALRATADFVGAESAYRRAVSLRPDYAAARHNLGALLGQLQRAEESLAELERAAALGVSSHELYFNRGRALIEVGRFDEADQALTAAAVRAPADPDTQILLAKLRFMRGDPDFVRSLQAAARDHPPLRSVLADLLRRADRHEEAHDILQSMLASDGWNPDTAAGLAVVLQEQGRIAQALKHARAAFAARRSDSANAEALTVLLIQSGLASEALPLIEEQRARQPLDQRWLAHSATAARLTGDRRYEELYDYARFVLAYDLQAPPGYHSTDEFNQDLVKHLAQLHGQGFNTHPLDQSLRSGTQTARSLLADVDQRIQAFLKALEAPLADYQAAIGSGAEHPLTTRNSSPARIVGCWSVRLHRGGFHVNHIHPEGWISSAYYVQVPQEVEDTNMKSGWIQFGEPRLPTPGADPAHFVQPRAGRLVLFPSYMWHGTTPIHGDEPRMTIAFDAVPSLE